MTTEAKTNEKLNPGILAIISGIIIMLCLGTVYSWSVFRLPIETLFGIGATLSGLPYMTALAVYAISMMLTGRILSKVDPVKLIWIGGLFVTAGWVLSAFVNNAFALTFTYGVLSGAGVGIIYGVPMAVVARWFPEKRGFAVGLVLLGFGLSPLITAPIARQLVNLIGVRETFLTLGIVFGIVITLFAIAQKYPEVASTNASSSASSKANQGSSSGTAAEVTECINTKQMMKTQNFIGLYLNFIIGTLIGLTAIGITSTIGVESFSLTPNEVAYIIPIFAVFNGLGRPLFGWIIDKTSGKKAMLVAYAAVLIAAFIMLTANTGETYKFILAFSLLWLSLGAWLSIAPTTTIRYFGTTHYSQNYGTVFTAYGVGAILGVMSSGILLDMFTVARPIFLSIAALSLIGSIITVLVVKE